MRRIALLLVVLLLLVAASVSSLGQAGTSTVRGTVTDQQGNVVAGATVTLTSLATTTSRTTTTADVGVYTFDFVPPGDYKLEISATGFKRAVVNNLHALVSQPTPVDVRLEVGM